MISNSTRAPDHCFSWQAARRVARQPTDLSRYQNGHLRERKQCPRVNAVLTPPPRQATVDAWTACPSSMASWPSLRPNQRAAIHWTVSPRRHDCVTRLTSEPRQCSTTSWTRRVKRVARGARWGPPSGSRSKLRNSDTQRRIRSPDACSAALRLRGASPAASYLAECFAASRRLPGKPLCARSPRQGRLGMTPSAPSISCWDFSPKAPALRRGR